MNSPSLEASGGRRFSIGSPLFEERICCSFLRLCNDENEKRTRKEKEKENMHDMFICVYASVVFLLFVRMSAAFRTDKKTISPFFND